MIKSMTGFGSAVGEAGGFNCRVEIKTLNNRFKEFIFRSHHFFCRLEEPIKKMLSNYLTRGRIEIWIEFEDLSPTSSNLTLNMDLAKCAFGMLSKLKEEFNLPEPITLGHLLSLEVISSQATDCWQYKGETTLDDVMALTKSAAEQLADMRLKEGLALTNDLRGRLSFLFENVEELKKLASLAPLAAVKRYRARLEELAETFLAQDRLAQEAGILADKIDITEETTRFSSHLQSFSDLLNDNAGPVGRRLEFLIQEMVREVNTMGSKAQSKPIADIVLDFKCELEKIREQVLNIE
ncbi:MAG: YicC family protein [Deltaproteobacteria bacterium]|jgi:uncharacterized protein (TIGR00255 family)|nr:YicC family protein [Deltaproteobacteria bacterium]